jgi:aspartate dehydrogenase
MTVGVVGCGTIGSALIQALRGRFRASARLTALYDADAERLQKILRRFRLSVAVLPPAQLVRRCDLVIEAASPRAVEELLPWVIRYRRPMMILSTGGLLRNPRLLTQAIKRGVPLHLPSGALGGLDAVKAAAEGQIHSMTLTTRKSPRALRGAPGLPSGIRLERLRTPRVVFSGSAAEAVVRFPQNINVAATLALAGIGPRRMRVRLIADPRINKNVHEVEVLGNSGRILTRTENRPFPENPKTSRLAVFSAIATLRQIFQPMRVGT